MPPRLGPAPTIATERSGDKLGPVSGTTRVQAATFSRFFWRISTNIMPKKSCVAALAVVTYLCILAPSARGLTTTSDARIVDARGQEVTMRGINIMGFNNNFRGPGDLNAGYDSLTKHFSHVIWRIQSLGFNAVRLPFTFDVLNQGVDYWYGPRPCTEASFEEALKETTPPFLRGTAGAADSRSE